MINVKHQNLKLGDSNFQLKKKQKTIVLLFAKSHVNVNGIRLIFFLASLKRKITSQQSSFEI